MNCTDHANERVLASVPLAERVEAYWHAVRTLRDPDGAPDLQTHALQALLVLARQEPNDRLRCAAGGTLVSLGLYGLVQHEIMPKHAEHGGPSDPRPSLLPPIR